jgi:N6-L-threonylcarbamoyladenine synthase
MRILGIETSCDETAAAVVEGDRNKVKVLSNVVASQIEIHKKYGGVVPEVAAREHVLNILPVVNEALEKAGAKIKYPTQPPLIKGRSLIPLLYKEGLGEVKGIDAVAVTTGPGLITSLQVGVETAKVLSYVWNIPAISVNHIEGHIYANFVSESKKTKKQKNKKAIFPAIILTVSGGHTMLILMKGHGKYQIVGETLDDAAGEAFDKAAAMLGIGYPGGPIISAYANKFKIQSTKSQINSKSIILPRPMINSKDYNFSFSGLKTALLYQIQKDPTSPLNIKGLRGASINWKKRIPEYAHEFQQAVIDVLVAKTVRAAKELEIYPVKSGEAGARQSEQFNRVKTIMLSGGVAANTELRKQMEEKIKKEIPGSNFLIPDLQYTTDNATMIAAVGYFKALRKEFTPWQKLKAKSDSEL